MPFGDYFTKGNTRLHLIGILGGVIWNIGMSFSIIAAPTAGPALSYGLGQGATMVGAFWGVFIWKEFKDAPPGTDKFLAAMFAFYLLGLGDSDRLQTLNDRSNVMTKKAIVVVGSSNTDMIIKLDRIPRPGETILGGEFVTAPGGKGANQAVAAARAGGRVTLVARVGGDMFGDQAVAGFVKDRIDVEHVVRDKAAPSGVALIFVAKDGENSIAVAPGANASLSPADVKRAAASIAAAAASVMQLETPLPTVQAAARIAAKTGVRVILNPAPAQPLPDDLLRLVSILTPNETEAELLTGIKVEDEKSAGQAADRLLARGVQTVIITLGSRGAFVATEGLRKLVRGFKMRAVEHHGGGRRLQRSPGRGACRGAGAAAGRALRQCGGSHFRDAPRAQPSAPRRKEIDKLAASAG